MKINKFFAAALTATTLFASCSKEQCNDAFAVTDKVLSVKVVNPILKSRAVGLAAAGAVILQDGVIFIIGPTGSVTAAEAIIPGTDANGIASAAGQRLTDPVAADSRVYIVANVGAVNVADWTTTSIPANLNDVNDLVMAIADSNPNSTDYTLATLANSDATAVQISMKAGFTTEAEVTVPINPVYSRMELAQVRTTSANITSFKVKAVYVDDYYSSYTIGGSYRGAIFSMNQGGATSVGTANELMREEHDPAIASVSKAVVPAAGERWYFHVPSGNLPRLVIELTDVVAPGYTTAGTTYYLTVSGYTGLATANFESGKIYRIGAADGIKFNEGNISLTPNPVEVDLYVNVSISQWEIEDIEPIF